MLFRNQPPQPTVGWALVHVFLFLLAVLSKVGQARGKQNRASSSRFRIPPLGKLPRGHPGQESPGLQHNSWNCRLPGHLHGLESPQSGSLEMWLPHKLGCGVV